MRKPLIKPKPLSPGDTIGIVSPSGAFLDREAWWVRMRAYLEGAGYHVKVGANALRITGYTSGTTEERIEDLHTLWADPTVKAIFCSQGGVGTMHLLDQLDYPLFARSPKILLGYSDVSALLLAIHHQTGLVTFHGPMAISDFGKPVVDPFTAASCWKILAPEAGQTFPYRIENAYQAYYQTLRPGVAEGPIIVGNLQLLSSLVGSDYLPDLSGAILLIEDVASFIYLVDRMLTQLRLAGVFSQLAGLIFGEFIYMMEDNPVIPLNTQGAPTILELVRSFAARLEIPVGFGFSCGHGDAKATIPEGALCRFDADSGTLMILEPYLQ